MRKSRLLAGIAAIAALATTAACGSGSGGGSSSSGFNAGVTGVVNASNSTTGMLKFVTSTDWDSPDPGNSYDAFSWDFMPIYERTLMAFKPVPGKAGDQLVPDLATAPGTPTDGGKTWTYHIRHGVKYSNGQTVTAQDVAYDVYRSNWGHSVLPNGPTYFINLMDPGAASGGNPTYPGPYKGSKAVPSALMSTPDPYTIVFHLVKPFADFNYLAGLSQTAPVPASADTGAQYVNHILATGPYMIDNYTPGKGMTLSKNPYFTAADNVNNLHPQRANKIDVQVKMAPDTVDNQLLANQAATDLSGNGVQSAAQAKIMPNPQLRKNADDPVNGFLYYANISTKVAPFTDINCRKAVEYAADKSQLQLQYGGPTGGEIAHTILPPTVNGYTDYPDQYPTPGNNGDPAKAKQLIAQCKQDLGSKFTNQVTLTYRSDKPKEVAAAAALQTELQAVGFKVSMSSFPFATYGTDFAGAPAYADSHNFGIMMMEWGADWPDGYGFMYSIIDGNSIVPAGNSNMSQLNDPTVNNMMSSAISNLNESQRDADWGKIDQTVMQQAVILPIVYGKALLYRPSNATNVFVQTPYGFYDYPQLGSK